MFPTEECVMLCLQVGAGVRLSILFPGCVRSCFVWRCFEGSWIVEKCVFSEWYGSYILESEVWDVDWVLTGQ